MSKLKVKWIDDPNQKQREQLNAQEEQQREARYCRGYSHALVDVRILLAGGATRQDVLRFLELVYIWRRHRRVYSKELSNMTAGSPTKFVFQKDKHLLELYTTGLHKFGSGAKNKPPE
jgi:hypothetical protein